MHGFRKEKKMMRENSLSHIKLSANESLSERDQLKSEEEKISEVCDMTDISQGTDLRIGLKRTIGTTDEATEYIYRTDILHDIVTESATLTYNFKGKIKIFQSDQHQIHYLFIS